MPTVVLLGLLLAGPSVTLSAPASFETSVRPVLAKYCFGCHGEKKQLADVRLDRLSADSIVGPNAETWHDVLGKLNLGEMPPEDEAQPTVAERAAVVDWLTEAFARAAAEGRSTGGRVVMRRLTRYEYSNTMRDLLGIDLDFGADLPPDSKSPDGFENNGSTLALSPLQVELYLKAARDGLAKAIVTGPEPTVVRALAEKPGDVRRVKGKVSNRLQGATRFLLRLDEFPREGRFLVRVRARAEIPEGSPEPRLQIAVGVRADVRAPQRTLAEVDVPAGDEARTFEFTGRIEAFPQPGHNPKYPGLLVTAASVDTPGSGAVKRGKKNAEDPTRPVIVVESLEFEGPLFDAWPPSTHTAILFPSETREADESAYAREVLRRFGKRAFRRPMTDAELTDFAAFFDEIRPEATSFEEAIRETLAMMLVSPDFLFLVEPIESPDAPVRPLTDHELAARLSYFLWSTMPDAELTELADAGRLRDPQVLTRTVRRMVADPRSAEFVEHFAGQWLDLSAVDRIAVNPEYFPQFDERLKTDMQRETRLFFDELLRENRSALELIDADFTFVNERLAAFYGLEAPAGKGFQRVGLAGDDRRGGLLGQGSVLLGTSNGEESHPIKRAVWLRSRLLDDPPAPPPPDVPDLAEEKGETAGLSLAKRLAAHRTKAACNACHRGIDPWGLAFENYDAIGRWRTEYERPKRRGKPRPKSATLVDATATLPGGETIDGIDGLKRHLLTTARPKVARAIVRKLLTYSLGRSLESTDEDDVAKLVTTFEENDHRLADLVLAIITSEPFLTR